MRSKSGVPISTPKVNGGDEVPVPGAQLLAPDQVRAPEGADETEDPEEAVGDRGAGRASCSRRPRPRARAAGRPRASLQRSSRAPRPSRSAPSPRPGRTSAACGASGRAAGPPRRPAPGRRGPSRRGWRRWGARDQARPRPAARLPRPRRSRSASGRARRSPGSAGWPSDREKASVHHQLGPGDVRGLVGGQEQDRVGHFLDPAFAAEGHRRRAAASATPDRPSPSRSASGAGSPGAPSSRGCRPCRTAPRPTWS